MYRVHWPVKSEQGANSERNRSESSEDSETFERVVVTVMANSEIYRFQARVSRGQASRQFTSESRIAVTTRCSAGEPPEGNDSAARTVPVLPHDELSEGSLRDVAD